MSDEMPYPWPNQCSVALSISFDDARPSQVEQGFSVLEACRAKATFYANPGNLGKHPDAWKTVARAGHEIGNHTVSHPCSINFEFSRKNALEDYSLDRMEAELLDCNRQIESLLGTTPRTFAYPCGQTFVGRGGATQSYVPLVARNFLAGRVFMSESHNTPTVCDLAQLYARPFDQVPFETLRRWIEDARRDSGWLILAGHDMGEEDRHQVVRLDILRTLCEYALDPANGIWLDTVAAVAEWVRDRQSFPKGVSES